MNGKFTPVKRKRQRSASNNLDTITKRSRKFRCECPHISLDTCHICAKIARKIYRLFGKRLALTDVERYTKSPTETADQEDGMLVFADEACDCPELSSEDCSTCTAFAIKMGMFVNIYSKKGLTDEAELTNGKEAKYKGSCDCAYLSAIDCDSCSHISDHIEQIFGKKVYPPSTSVPSLTPHISAVPATVPSSSSRYVALDCEMVGVMNYNQTNARGLPKMVNALARCSIVDVHYNVLLDIYAKPDRPIADYRTRYSGITKSDMTRAVPTEEARRAIIATLKDKIVIGHTIDSDFAAIKYVHPAGQCRDIVKCRTLRDMYLRKTRLRGPGLQRIGLKKLSAVLLGSNIQQGSHCSVEDAIHTMKLYLLVQKAWESRIEAGDPSDTLSDEDWHPCNIDSQLYLGDSYWPAKADEH